MKLVIIRYSVAHGLINSTLEEVLEWNLQDWNVCAVDKGWDHKEITAL